jgi:hypothetical protein
VLLLAIFIYFRSTIDHRRQISYVTKSHHPQSKIQHMMRSRYRVKDWCLWVNALTSPCEAICHKTVCLRDQLVHSGPRGWPACFSGLALARIARSVGPQFHRSQSGPDEHRPILIEPKMMADLTDLSCDPCRDEVGEIARASASCHQSFAGSVLRA